MMENPQMHKKMMRMMIKNMHGDSAKSGMQGMMDDKMDRHVHEDV
ncbi:hypothetical protein [Aliifodinibius sp. S!AR15-10]|nr:hypothetical protein [Aliifodinibius sp. S!AR15-10]